LSESRIYADFTDCADLCIADFMDSRIMVCRSYAAHSCHSGGNYQATWKMYAKKKITLDWRLWWEH